MKKILSVILAFVLLALPLCASAEVLDVPVLLVSDLVVTEDGETVVDLTGLGLQLAAAVKPDFSEAQLFLDLLSDGENVNSAMVQIDRNSIAALLGGMSNAYGVSLEDLFGALFGSGEGSTDSAEQQMEELLSKLEELLGIFDEPLISEGSIVIGEPEEREYADGVMTYVPFSADLGKDFVAFLEKLASVSLAQELLGTQLQELVDELKQTEVVITVKGEMGTDEANGIHDLSAILTLGDGTDNLRLSFNGSCTGSALEAALEVYNVDDSQEEFDPEKDLIDLKVNARYSDSYLSGDATLIVREDPEYDPEDAETYTAEINANWSSSTLQGSLRIDRKNDYEYESLLNASLFGTKDETGTFGEFNVLDSDGNRFEVKYSGANGSASATLRYLSADYYWDSFTVDFTRYEKSGSWTLNVESDGTRIMLMWAKTGEGSGNVLLSVDDGYSVTTISLNVAYSQAQLDTDQFHIASFLDLLSLSEQEGADAMNELTNIVGNMLQTLSERYEALAMILGSADLESEPEQGE